MSSDNLSPHDIHIPEPLQNLVLSWGLPIETELAFYEAIVNRLCSVEDCDPNQAIPLEITVPGPGESAFQVYGHIRIRRDHDTGTIVIIDARFEPLPCYDG